MDWRPVFVFQVLPPALTHSVAKTHDIQVVLSPAIVALMALGVFSTSPQTIEARTGVDSTSSISPAPFMRSGLVYISHITLDHASVLDPETNRIIGRITSGNGTCCVDLLPGVDRGYIANFNSNDVTVFDRKTGKTLATVRQVNIHLISV